MNKYRLKMKTLSGRGIEYITLYATSNFERYALEHNLKYVRDITQDYQLTTRFNELEEENKQLKILIENIKLGVVLNDKQEKLLDKVLGDE